MALSSMGHSQASAQSLQSIAGAETERKISFVIHEPENVSGGSNATVSRTNIINAKVLMFACSRFFLLNHPVAVTVEPISTRFGNNYPRIGRKMMENVPANILHWERMLAQNFIHDFWYNLAW